MRRHAYSLVELVITLAIVATLALLIAPRYSASMTLRRLDSTTRRIAADLAEAQARAESTGSSVSVSFHPAGTSYTISGAGADRTVRLDEPPYRSRIVGTELGTEARDVIYDGFGRPDEGGTIIVRAGDLERTLSVSPSGGEVTVR